MPNKNRDRDRLNREIGPRIRAHREAAGLSQEALAAQLGITQQQLGRYEAGTSTISAAMLAQIKAVLKCPTVPFTREPDHEPRPSIARLIDALDTLDGDQQDSISDGVVAHIKVMKKASIAGMVGVSLALGVWLAHPMLDPDMSCPACKIATHRDWRS
jgi:transcriptional regulator with XRE-family HTH domain